MLCLFLFFEYTDTRYSILKNKKSKGNHIFYFVKSNFSQWIINWKYVCRLDNENIVLIKFQ